jgi:hypothetical protein
MKRMFYIGFASMTWCCMVGVSLGQETPVVPPPQATFPPSENCTANTPCKNVTGEVVKIEESYWVQLSDGTQTHVRVKPNTKIDSRIKVGDSIAAQLTSKGDAEAVIKLSETPQSLDLPMPSKGLRDVR